MAQTIYNTSQVIDNSTEPPVIVTSNQVQTVVRQIVPPTHTTCQCIVVVVCPEECCSFRRPSHSNNCHSNFPEIWRENEENFGRWDRGLRNSNCCCDRKNHFNFNNW